MSEWHHIMIGIEIIGPDRDLVVSCRNQLKRVISKEQNRLLRKAKVKKTNTCFSTRYSGVRDKYGAAAFWGEKFQERIIHKAAALCPQQLAPTCGQNTAGE